jgi:hypothetical protein
MELDTGQPAGRGLEAGHRRAGRSGGDRKPLRRNGYAVAVAHPDVLLRWHPLEEHALRLHPDRGAAELPPTGVRHLATERPGHRLEAVADPENRYAGGEEGRIDLGRPGFVHAGRAAGQDDRGRLPGEHLGHRHRVRDDLRVDLRLPDPAGDQLGILRAEVDDENGVLHRQIVSATS